MFARAPDAAAAAAALAISPHRPPVSSFGPLLRHFRSYLPASHLAGPVSTAEGSLFRRRSASGAARSSRADGGGARSRLSRGDPRLRRRKSPPDAAGVSRRHRPSLPRRAGPGPCPCRGGGGLPSRRRFPHAFLLLEPVGQPLFESPLSSSPLPSPSPPVLSPHPPSPHPSTPPEARHLGGSGHGVRGHSEKDSGFRPAAEPGVPEAAAMCAIVGAHLGGRLPCVCGRGHRRLLLGRRRVAAEVPPDGAVPLRRRLVPPHHRWDSAPGRRGARGRFWGKESGDPVSRTCPAPETQ